MAGEHGTSGDSAVANDALVQEVRQAFKGRGIADHAVTVTGESPLGRLCGVFDADGPEARIHKITTRLRDLAAGLPDDLRLAFLVAAGLHGEAAHRFLRERTLWLAAHLDRTFRTAQRLIAASVERVAAMAGAGNDNPHAPEGWWMRSIQSTVRIGGDRPLVSEEREIVAVTDGLREIVVSTAVIRHPTAPPGGGPRFDVVHGGRLLAVERPCPCYFRYRISLPASLRPGEGHRLGVRFQFPPGVPMGPRYTYQPVRPCRSFGLTLQFAAECAPATVWRISGLPRAMIEDFADDREMLSIEETTELRLSFSELRPGLAYGARWLDGPLRPSPRQR